MTLGPGTDEPEGEVAPVCQRPLPGTTKASVQNCWWGIGLTSPGESMDPADFRGKSSELESDDSRLLGSAFA